MRVANAGGRLGLVIGDVIVDVASASSGRFGPEVQPVYDRWDEFEAWAGTDPSTATADRQALGSAHLGPPAPAPRQVFAIGLNYLDHAEESAMDAPSEGMVVFTKFPSSITGPTGVIELPPGSVDFEAELVAVIGRRAHRVTAADAWDHVAGLTVGQDLSERELQLRPPTPQFSLGKSYPGFSPLGPLLMSPDEVADRDDLEISCALNGREMQRSRTKMMIFSVADIVSRLSAVVPLLPGDVVFTGTPSGIGWARDPKILLQDGDELVTTIDGLGSMRHQLVAGPSA